MATARLWLSEMAASFAAEQQQQEAPSLCITRKYLTHTHTYIYIQSIVYRVIYVYRIIGLMRANKLLAI